MGKKKATGMSKRLGFTDRATIAENKEILRYNERLEREAKGLPPEAEQRGGRPQRGPSARGSAPQRRSAEAPRAARPPRPPALDDAQRVSLEAALAAAVGETGMDEAGAAVITRLAAHDSFDKASNAGWEIAAGGHASERTPSEWDLLRKTWLSIRIALLEAYVLIKPELEPTLARERKQVERLNRPQRPAKRRRTRPPGSGDGEAAAGRPERPARSERRKAPAGPPSPADIARRLGKAPVSAGDAEAALAPDGGAVAPPPEAPDAPDAPDAAVELAAVAADVTPEVVESVTVVEDAAPEPELRAPEHDAPESDASEPDAPELEAAVVSDGADVPADGPAVAEELRAEHGTRTDLDVDTDQLTLDV